MSVVEILCVLALFGTLLGALAGAARRARIGQREADGYAADVAGLRRTLATLERDLRGARSLSSPVRATTLISTDRGVVTWRRRGDALYREEDGVESVVARRVAFLRIAPADPGYRIYLGPVPRAGTVGPAAGLESVVVPRLPQERR
jgi:hypothetical protein